MCAQVGKISDVRFTNISAVAEAGVVVVGCPESTVEDIVFEGLNLELSRQTDGVGGFLDYRPGLRDVVDDVTTSAVFIEFANHATLNNVEVLPVSIPMNHMYRLRSTDRVALALTLAGCAVLVLLHKTLQLPSPNLSIPLCLVLSRWR